MPTDDKKIRGVKGNTAKLLEFGGFKNIRDAKKSLGENDNKKLYKDLLNAYNDTIDTIRDQQLRLKSREKNRISKIKEEARRIKRNETGQVKRFRNKVDKQFDILWQTGKATMPLDQKKLPFKDFIKILIEKTHNKKVLLRTTLNDGREIVYALNDYTRQRLYDIIRTQLYEEGHQVCSDGVLFAQIWQLVDIQMEVLNETHQRQNHNGAFFKYTNKTDIDLSRQGIFNEFKASHYDDNCLVYALQQAGVCEDRLDRIRNIVKNRNIPLKDLKKICETLEICIVIRKIDKEEHVERNKYGAEFETKEKYYIGLIDNHFFLIEPINITSYVVKNYWAVKDVKNYNNIIAFDVKNNKYVKKNGRSIDTYDVVKLMVENKETHLESITFENSNIASTQFYDKIDGKISNLDYTEANVRLMVDDTKKPKKETKPIEFKNVFFDFETYLVNKNGRDIHVPYLCCSIDEKGIKQTFYGDKCGLKLLCSLTSNTRLIAHNATYDYRFLINYLYGINEIGRGTKLIACHGKFGKFEISIKDSLHLISMPLKQFPKTFNLESVKEVMPYEIYNATTVNDKFLSIEYAKTFIHGAESQEQFMTNIERWNLYDETRTKYDIVEYSKRYCELDCLILQQGYNTFRGWILEGMNIDVDNIVTSASLADLTIRNDGCYDGVYELSGVPQMFIQKCVVGGRTMVANNVKTRVEKHVQDFDAVSLYPSAMNRMEGYLIGKPKVITDFDKVRDTADGYFVEIVITNIKKHLRFPILCFKSETGVQTFSNDIIGKTFHVDKVTLEDAVKYQQIEYEFVRGYYYDEGFNTKIKETMRNLFNMRLQKKKEKNKCELVYKLIMNSGYGRRIMKAIETETRIFDNQHDFQVFLSRNYNWVKCYTLIEGGDKIKVESMKSIIDHYNTPQLGVMVLSWSKRIMNEVMTLAEDAKINIYYQDTDSMHIDENQIETLSNLYQQTYGRELIGKDMGQFHSDFDFEGHTDVRAVRSIFLGKKAYIDELEGTAEDGTIDTSYHIRMKGVPNAVLEYTSHKLGYKTPFQMYEDLYNGKEIKFDLTNDGTKVNFKFSKNYEVHTLTEFNRRLKF